MTMKRTELEKRQGMVIVNAQRRSGNAFDRARSLEPDRKARRAQERAAGLVPIAFKLPASLVARLRQHAAMQQRHIDDLAAELLCTALPPARTVANEDRP